MSEGIVEKREKYGFVQTLKKGVQVVKDEAGQKFIRKRSTPEKTIHGDRQVSADDADKAVRLLKNEYACQSRIDHPNVPKVREFHSQVKPNGRVIAYLIMDFMPPGISLSSTLKERNEEEAFKALLDAAKALKASHLAGVLHHDIKPGNILFGPQGGYLIDFGTAKIVGKNYYNENLGVIYTIATIPYLAPEQVHGMPRKETDIYQLGRTIYTVATRGKADETHQYTTNNPTEYRPPLPLEEVNPRIKDNKSLKDLIEQTMNIIIDRRPDLDSVISELENQYKYFSRFANHGKLFGR